MEYMYYLPKYSDGDSEDEDDDMMNKMQTFVVYNV